MAVDAVTPDDPRIEHKFITLGHIKYHYVLAKPKGTPTATVLLAHGWPDIWYGWRNQIPFLLSLNLQVIVPDMLGYGQTDAPDAVEEYFMKKMAAHILSIIKEHTDQPIILGGHDWGGFFVWRFTYYYPEWIRGVFSICTPWIPPAPEGTTLEMMVQKNPNFRYMLQLSSGEAEAIVNKSPRRIRGVMDGFFGGLTPEGKPATKVSVGVLEENLERIQPATYVSKDVVDYYVQEHSRHGFHGPCNWYRTRAVIGADDPEYLKNAKNHRFSQPAMLVMAEKDEALTTALAEGQEKYFPAGLKRETCLGADHWLLHEVPDEVNKYIGEFVKSVLGDELKASL
ncbi:hypothetical protein M426DRAFT_317038 [Hypoxylon sp. CI-4A]|nr:hypothetical protein M426DRAFT_317038 [Hypoxylon sp. CI-4A]